MESSSKSLLRQAKAHAAALEAIGNDTFSHSRALRLAPPVADSSVPDSEPATATGSTIPMNSSVSDLLGLDGEAFVEAAYRAALGRSPDPVGREYHLRNLENGSRTKVQILGELTASEEGRRADRRIRGLRAHGLVERLSALPIAGYLIQWGLSFIRLPVTLRALEHRRSLLAREVGVLREEIQHARGRLDELRTQVGSRAGAAELQALERRIEKNRTLDSEGFRRLADEVNDIRARNPDFPPDVLQRLEVHFRGDEAGIERHLANYIPHLPDPDRLGKRAVDIGPGRGEWLRVAAEKGFEPVGIDTNPAVVHSAQSRGHPVSLGDGVDYLKQMPDESCAVVSAFHVVEHLPFATVLELIGEAARVLRPGGVIILETPNPESLYVGACSFWNDPTHRAPIPPKLLDYLVENAGFETETLRMNPSMPESDLPDDAETARILHWLFGHQDYAVVGKRVTP
jgi:O-antigen chain-terminating methyltransferase